MKNIVKKHVAFFLLITCCIVGNNIHAHADTPRKAGLIRETPEQLKTVPKITPEDTIRKLGRQGLIGAPSSYDFSAHMPPVGDQGEAGSCAAWATGYYAKCYQENRDSNWELEKNGWTRDELCSPAFLYNQNNGGEDTGSILRDVITTVTRMGIPSWNDMPYSPNPYVSYPESSIDYSSLPSKQVYKKAIPYRGESYSMVFYDYPDDSEIETMKNLIAAGEPIIFGTDVAYSNYTSDFGGFDDDDHCVDSQRYSTGGHGMTIVGYDDNFDGSEHGCSSATTGAFKVVNQYGTDWGSNGYVWYTYKAAKNNMWYGYTLTDKDDYEPTVLAEIDIDYAKRGYLFITFMAGAAEYVFLGDSLAIENWIFDERSSINMWVDLTDLYSGNFPTANGETWALKIENNNSYAGEVQKFEITTDDCTLYTYVTPSAFSYNSTKIFSVSPMALESVTPSSSFFTITNLDISEIKGKNFCSDNPDVQVLFKMYGKDDLVATDVTVVSDTRITCKISPDASAPGQWNLNIRNNTRGQEAELQNAFELLGYSYHIPINKGWNFLGVPLKSAIMAPAEAFNTEEYAIYSRIGNDMENMSNTSMIMMDTASGYWIYSENGIADMGIAGNEITGSTYYISMDKGWQIFSNPFITNVNWTSENALLMCRSEYQDLPDIFRYDPVAGYEKIAPNATGEIVPWEAYWIKTPDINCSLQITK